MCLFVSVLSWGTEGWEQVLHSGHRHVLTQASRTSRSLLQCCCCCCCCGLSIRISPSKLRLWLFTRWIWIMVMIWMWSESRAALTGTRCRRGHCLQSAVIVCTVAPSCSCWGESVAARPEERTRIDITISRQSFTRYRGHVHVKSDTEHSFF